jgi:hypothetical protein
MCGKTLFSQYNLLYKADELAGEDMLWTRLNALFDRFGALSRVSFVFVGCGLCRSWLGWALSTIRSGPAFIALGGGGGILYLALVSLSAIL